MHRFYLSPGLCQETNLLLSGQEAHHALHVLRLRRGDRVMVLDGEGHQCDCEIAEPARDHLTLRVLERRSVPPLPYQISLVQAIPKGKIIESIIQKATELGVFRIVPLLAHRTVAKLDAGDEKAKAEKWRSVAVEAIKQCGAAWLPQIETPRTIEQFLSQPFKVELALVGSLQEDARHPQTYFQAFVREHDRKPKSASVAVGPEGDFTPEELSALQSAGARPVSLGPTVLRSETAALYCLSFLNYELQSGLGRQ